MNLEKLVQKYQKMVNASSVITDFPDAILFVNIDGYITEANQKALELFHITDSRLLNDIFEDGMKYVKVSVKFNKPVLVKASSYGKTFYTEINAARVKQGYCLAVRDVTKLTNEALKKDGVERFNGEKNAMLYKLESEFLSPLSSIVGFSQGLLDGIGGALDEKQKKYLKIINSNAVDLHKFLDKFLEFTYAEASIYEPEFKQFDVISSIKGILKSFEKNISGSDVQINFEYEDIDARTIYNDFNAFTRAITNILSVSVDMTEHGNIFVSLKYPDEETALTYGIEEPKAYLHIMIKDTGVGIAQNELKYLCDPYTQLEGSKKNLMRSFKLGSASIFLKRMGAFISISSEVSQGTIYNIIIPIKKDEYE